MKHCSKTNYLNSIISVSNSRKLDLIKIKLIKLGVNSVRGTSGVDYLWGSGVLGITLGTFFWLM